MKDSWHNNLIGKKLNEEYAHDFSICDIDGAVRCGYKEYDYKTRFIIYESKYQNEKLSTTQLDTLKLLNKAIHWDMFDTHSGIFIIRIFDIENDLRWFDLEDNLIAKTTFKELYNIFSVK